MSIREQFRASLESHDQPKQEIEYCFFARLEDLSVLDQAPSKELQEQWQLFKDCGEGVEATIRVRATDDRTWILCTKVKRPGVLGKEEVEVPTTRAMFEHFKLLGDQGLRKTRYCYPIEGTGLTWEIDVFENPQGVRSNWVKIDLEVPAALESVPPFPIEFEEVILNQHKQRTPEENALIDRLFAEEYTLTPKMKAA